MEAATIPDVETSRESARESVADQRRTQGERDGGETSVSR